MSSTEARGTRHEARGGGEGGGRAFKIFACLVVGAGLLAVIGGAFALSFEATREVGIASRIMASVAWLLPVAIDGAMMVATVVAMVLRRLSRSSSYPMAVVIVGTLLSIAINGVHATGGGVETAGAGTLVLAPLVRFLVSAIPGAMLALSVHLAAVLFDAFDTADQAPATATHATHATIRTAAPQVRRPAAKAVEAPVASARPVEATASASAPVAEAVASAPVAPLPRPLPPQRPAAPAPVAPLPRPATADAASTSAVSDDLAPRRQAHTDRLEATRALASELGRLPKRDEAKAVLIGGKGCGSKAADLIIAQLRAELDGSAEPLVKEII